MVRDGAGFADGERSKLRAGSGKRVLTTGLRHASLTPNQIRGFWAAWAGIVLDGMDSFIYALVLVPAMRDLLPASGIPPTPGNLGYYGSILFASFLVGWGCAFLWGPVADRFGRVRSLMLAILCYSLFTFLGCMARNVWQLGVFRLLAGFGVGGEFCGGRHVRRRGNAGSPARLRSRPPQ